MKKIFTLVMLSLFALLGAKAVEFDANTKYRFVCNYYSSGSLVLGSQHGQTAYVCVACIILNINFISVP